jgi:SAM-dependent methyltransferase
MTTSQSWEQAVQWLRGQLDQQDLVRGAYQDDPLIVAAQRYRESPEWQAIRPWLGVTGGLALDIGAGRGIASYALALEGFQVTAIEPDPSGIVGAGAIRALAEEAQLSINVMQAYSEQLPLPSAEVDLVFARAALHHAADLNAACREFYRVLRPGGRLVAVREHVISRRSDLPRFLAAHPLHKLYGGENAYLLREYRSALHSAGFTILSQLSPLGSPINFAPHTNSSLRGELYARIERLPFGRIFRNTVERFGIGDFLLSIVRAFDNRPGRLYSWVATKAESVSKSTIGAPRE